LDLARHQNRKPNSGPDDAESTTLVAGQIGLASEFFEFQETVRSRNLCYKKTVKNFKIEQPADKKIVRHTNR
jgi:hypothetical protein